MRDRETSGTPADRKVWRRSREVEIVPDEAECLLDLAGFADNRLDDEDGARIAALIARDSAAADDVAAARSLAGATMLPADADVVARAEALVEAPGDAAARPEAELIAFPARPPTARPWYSAATWSGLAAAVVLAGWLGFDLGSGILRSPVVTTVDDAGSSELIDTTPLLLRDLTENSQT